VEPTHERTAAGRRPTIIFSSIIHHNIIYKNIFSESSINLILVGDSSPIGYFKLIGTPPLHPTLSTIFRPVFRIKMIRQIYRMLILLWTTLLIVLPFRAVVSFSGRSPSPHSQHKHSTCVHPSSGIFGTSSTDRRQSHHQAKAGNDDDAFDDDYYYPSTPRSAGTSPISSSPRPPRQPNSRDNTKVKYDEYYYEDDDEEEEGLPFREPLRTSGENEKLARYQSQQELDAYEDDEDYYYDDEDEDDEEEYDYDDEEEDSESSSFGGNFWSNPTGGIDRSKRPPTPQSPRVTSPRRRREDESYDPRSTRRRR
jgi:hypothetical protein